MITLGFYQQCLSGSETARGTEREIGAVAGVCNNLHLICFSSSTLTASFIFLIAPFLSE